MTSKVKGWEISKDFILNWGKGQILNQDLHSLINTVTNKIVVNNGKLKKSCAYEMIWVYI